MCRSRSQGQGKAGRTRLTGSHQTHRKASPCILFPIDRESPVIAMSLSGSFAAGTSRRKEVTDTWSRELQASPGSANKNLPIRNRTPSIQTLPRDFAIWTPANVGKLLQPLESFNRKLHNFSRAEKLVLHRDAEERNLPIDRCARPC